MYVIAPYVSAGPFSFGAVSKHTAPELGRPWSTEKNQLGETVTRYDGISVITLSNRVVEVSFLPTADVSISGVDAFNDPESLRELCVLDGNAKEYVGIIILLKLGVTMTGFHDGDTAQQVVTAFEKGRWDQLIGKLKDYWPA